MFRLHLFYTLSSVCRKVKYTLFFIIIKNGDAQRRIVKCPIILEKGKARLYGVHDN